MINDGINQLWPTTVYKTKLNNTLCDDLLEIILQKDFNGKTDLFNTESPIISKFEKEVYKIFSDYFRLALSKNLDDYTASFKSFVTSNSGAYSMPSHNHSSSPFVSVFYIFCSDSNKGGDLVLNDPRTNANRGYMTDFQDQFSPIHFTPSNGDVLVFPGYLYHSVNPFIGSLRIAVPVDLFLDNKV